MASIQAHGAFLDFPRTPAGFMKRHITDEADAQLAFYLPLPADPVPPGVTVPLRPQLSEGVVDTPLVRVFNFLRTSRIFPRKQTPTSRRDDVTIIPARDSLVSGRFALTLICRAHSVPLENRLSACAH